MLCYYLRHIDLLAVYEQLPTYDFLDDLALANIPQSISSRLAMHFDERAESSLEHLYGRPVTWQDFAHIDVAAEVGDYIERDIEALEEICLVKAPKTSSRLATEKWLVKFNAFISGVLGTSGISDYYLIQALLIYQYDCLCWLYDRGDFAGGAGDF